MSFNMELNIIPKNILEKNNCIMDGIERFYILSFEQKNYSLKFTNPISFKVGDFVCEKEKWSDVIIDYVKYLSTNCDLLKFKPNWCLESFVFTATSTKESWEIKINERLYFNYSVAINHIYLFIKDLILYGHHSLRNVFIKYTCMPIVEPIEIRNRLIFKIKSYFRMFLETNYNDIDVANKTIACIAAVNKRIRSFINSSYDNVYLITDKKVLQRTSTKFIDELKTNTTAKVEQIELIEKALHTYYEFFKFFLKCIKYKTFARVFGIF